MTEIKDESEVGRGSAPVTSLLLDALSSSLFFTKRDRPHMLVQPMFLFMSFFPTNCLCSTPSNQREGRFLNGQFLC